jgi:heat shock protein HslJ
MKKITIALSLIMTIVLSSCSILKKSSSNNVVNQELSGTWVLTYITGPRITFEGLYPEKKPTITFDLEDKRISGNTSCNSYGGSILLDKNKIKIEKPFTTMMACPGNGESTYINTLLKVETFKVNNDTLSFYMDDIEVMRFVRE